MAAAYPAALLVLLAAWAGLLPWAAGRLFRRLRAAKPGTGTLLFALVAGALAVRFAAVTPAHQVYYDEFEHLDAARRVAADGRFAVTTAGGLEGWDALARPTWPAGHHAALAAAMRVFGPATRVAFAWSAFLSALTVLFVFWAALELFGDERGALAAGCLWAVNPVVLRYAGACDLTSSSLFWCAAALAAIHARERESSPALDAFAALSLAYAVQVRFENVLLILYAAAACTRRELLIPAVLGLVFPAAIVHANHAGALPGFAGLTPWANFVRQAPSDLLYLSGPAALGLLLLPALANSFPLAPARRLLDLSALFLVVYASYYHGRFDSGSDDRYALSVLLPATLAAAPGLAAMSVPACLLAAGLAWGGPAAPDVEHEKARRFLEKSAKLVPENAFIAAYNPSFVIETAKRPAASPFLILEDRASFDRERARVGAASEIVLYRDWAWRARGREAVEMEAVLANGVEGRILAWNGLDSLVSFNPALRARR